MPDGSWNVVTNIGTIRARHVINATGLWAREIGQMAGVTLPLVPNKHHCFITGSIPELAQRKESVVVVDLDGEIYVRQEQSGALFGIYETLEKMRS